MLDITQFSVVTCDSRLFFYGGLMTRLGFTFRPTTGHWPLNTDHCNSVPADRSLIQIDINLLRFKIFFNSPWSEFAAEARLLVAAPRRFHVSRLHVVHPHNTHAQRL